MIKSFINVSVAKSARTREQGITLEIAGVLGAFTDEDTAKIVSTFHAWKRGLIVSGKALAAGESPDDSTTGYRDIPGFCKSASLDEIAEHG